MHPRNGATVIGLALVVLVATGAAAAVATDGTQSSTAVQSEGPAVTLGNQTSGGYTVTVASVTLPDGGFVTIHDATVTEGGKKVFSSVRGTSAYLSPGTHENVTVTLEEPVANASTLVAMDHRDTNGDHTYSFVASNGKADGPYTANDSAVIDTANVSVSATVTYDRSTTEGTYATVDRVELSEGGFVTIHDSSLTQGVTFDSVRGSSAYLDAGVHEDVHVKLDEPLNESDTLIAMPHKDTNDNQQYDFVDSDGAEDGPFTDANGEIVLASSEVEVVGDDAASVAIANQTTGGNLLYVDEAFVPSGGFVTIHDSSLADGDTFDSVRGTSEYLEPGHHSHVPIELDQPLNESDTVIAMPHKDTNGNEQYDFVDSDGAEDGPYTDGDRNIVTDSASATVSAGVHAHDQESAGDSITIASVDLSSPGFVTVHDASLTAGSTFESVRGSTYFEAGLHRNMNVSLDEPLRTSQAVYAMPHRDTNGNEQYDFVDSEGAADGPYTASGMAVFEPAQVTVEFTGTGTATETQTATEGDETTATSMPLGDAATDTGGQPGFGAAVALLALLSVVATLGRARRD